MKAVRFHDFGDVSVLKYEEAPRPIPGNGEVLVRVHAAGVNPIDSMVRAGYLRSMIPHSLPLIPGWDLSGTVEQLGAGVKHFSVGDGVYGQLDVTRNGAYAEYVATAADRIGKKPGKLEHTGAAAVPVAAMAAWQGLFGAGAIELKAGQTLLIHGAAGGVGTFAVQLAKSRGARVIGTGSAGSESFLRELGVDQFIDYNKDPFERVIKEVDAVLDSIGGETQARSWGIIKRGGALASLVGDRWTGTPEASIRKTAVFGALAAPQLGQITRLIDEGLVKPVISQILPLSEARKAHEMIEGRHTHGKIILRVI
jgi:NADPH:quinone reductase-like Zn-dependent oxidoreductase